MDTKTQTTERRCKIGALQDRAGFDGDSPGVIHLLRKKEHDYMTKPQATKKTYLVDWHDSISASDILEIFEAMEVEINEEVYNRLSENAKAFWREKGND